MFNPQVRTNGTTMAITIPITNIGMNCGMIEIKPGKPPTPIAEAWTLFSDRKMQPRAEPIRAA